jgi:hypothetical protein
MDIHGGLPFVMHFPCSQKLQLSIPQTPGRVLAFFKKHLVEGRSGGPSSGKDGWE